MATHNNLRYGLPGHSRDGHRVGRRRSYGRPDYGRPTCDSAAWYDGYGYDEHHNNYYDGAYNNSQPAEPERSFSPQGTFERFDPYGDWSDAEGGYLSNLPQGRSGNR